MGTSGMRLDPTHFTQLNSFNSSHTTELTQLISLSVPHSTSLNSSFVRRGTWTLLSPPPPLPKTMFIYVQGAMLQMTGDQGAVLLCAEEHERFCPPRPCPRLCSRCSASDDRRSRCSAFVCRGTWTLLSPPRPCQDYVQGAVLLMTGDQGAVLLCAGEHERFCPPPPLPRLCSRCSASDDRRSRCSAFVCRGTWTLLSPPPPLPRLCSRCSASDDRRSRCSAFVCRGTWTLLSPPPAPAKTMFKAQCFWWQAIKVQCFCVQRNMNAFVSPPTPQPNPKWLSQVMF